MRTHANELANAWSAGQFFDDGIDATKRGGERYAHDQNDEYSPKPICSIFSVKNWP
jgi:hypothetical protein